MTEHEKLTKKVNKLLVKLGPTKKSVLREISKGKIKAVPGHSCRCLFSLFFRKRLNLVVRTVCPVDPATLKAHAYIRVILLATPDQPAGVEHEYELPPHIAEVVRGFDVLEYPELVDMESYRQSLLG